MRKHIHVLYLTSDRRYKENNTIETRKLLWHWSSRQPLWIEKSKHTLRLWRPKNIWFITHSGTKSTTTFCLNASDFTANCCLNSFVVFRKSLTFMVCILVSLQLAFFRMKWENTNKISYIFYIIIWDTVCHSIAGDVGWSFNPMLWTFDAGIRSKN